jgi:hypothetical protein
LTLPQEIRDVDVLLTINGHNTRIRLLTAVILEMHGIDVLVLPSYSTHLLQMLHVKIAAAINAVFKRKLDE